MLQTLAGHVWCYLLFQIRRQAQSQTQKALSDGLLPEDMELVDEFMEELVRKRNQGVVDAR